MQSLFFVKQRLDIGQCFLFAVVSGHIQIAQAPDRHGPDSDGEINYKYVFSLLEKFGYDGYIGLEYKPLGN